MKEKIILPKNSAALSAVWPKKEVLTLLILAIVGAVCLQTASAQTWDNSQANGYVAKGYGSECTAFAHGRYKTLSGEWLRYINSSGQWAYPNAKLMYDFAVESPTLYHDSVSVNGALVAWNGPNGDSDPGHAGIIETIYSD